MKYLFLFLLFSLLLISGCKKPLEVKPVQTVASQDVYSFLVWTNGFSNIDCGMIGDSTYVFLSKEWVAGEFSSAFREWLEFRKTFKYVKDKNDCNRFTTAAYDFMGVLHANTERAPDSGVAFGEVWYFRQSDGLFHAVNVFVSRSELGDWELNFYEPQTQKIITLTPGEKRSCLFFRF